jgi:transcriptional regulator with XRE-family HTH domain
MICKAPISVLNLPYANILGYLKYLNMTFGEKISMLRKQLKWSQDELAGKIGTSAPIVGRYERGEIKPSIEVASKIADALNVTIDYLIGNSDKLIFDKKLLKRLEEIENLPIDEKDKVYYFIDMALAYNKTKKAMAH